MTERELYEKITRHIASQKGKIRTIEERTAQMESFVVGNSFDVFAEKNVINHGNVKELLDTQKYNFAK